MGYRESLRDWKQQEATSFTRSEGMREGAVIEPGERERIMVELEVKNKLVDLYVKS